MSPFPAAEAEGASQLEDQMRLLNSNAGLQKALSHPNPSQFQIPLLILVDGDDSFNVIEL